MWRRVELQWWGGRGGERKRRGEGRGGEKEREKGVEGMGDEGKVEGHHD